MEVYLPTPYFWQMANAKWMDLTTVWVRQEPAIPNPLYSETYGNYEPTNKYYQ